MKPILILIFCGIIPLLGGAVTWTEENRRIESEQAALWESKLVDARQKPPASRPADLWLGLRNMGYRKTYDGHSPEVDEIYQRLQNELLYIPGHAQYFADQIRRKQEEVKDLPPNTGERVSYDQMRQLHFETMEHLPSPETVRALGGFFYDTRDFAKVPDYRPGDIDVSGGSPSNSIGAVRTMSRLGLRQAPNYDVYARDSRENIPPWQVWWEEIKSGTKTFSFKGQSVEYRFKPDGTWETLAMANPPDDAPKSTKRVNETAVPTGNTWPWIIGAMVVLMAGMFWLGVRSKRAG